MQAPLLYRRASHIGTPLHGGSPAMLFTCVPVPGSEAGQARPGLRPAALTPVNASGGAQRRTALAPVHPPPSPGVAVLVHSGPLSILPRTATTGQISSLEPSLWPSWCPPVSGLRLLPAWQCGVRPSAEHEPRPTCGPSFTSGTAFRTTVLLLII